MKLDPEGTCHLTYCSNIHAGETWNEVRDNLENYLPQIKKSLVPDDVFGIGLRLSAVAAEALADDAIRSELKSFLDDQDLYVFTLNGFPYGEFHGTPVKENVYLPDWRDPARLNYTDTLADILTDILPKGMVGSISTVPGAFKSLINTNEQIQDMAENMIRHVAHLVKLRSISGKTITLSLEPEPCCFLETIDESVDFFTDYLFSDTACTFLGSLTGLSADAADAALRRHLSLCLDLCHAAVEFEDATRLIAKLDQAGITIGKMQISAGLRFAPVESRTIELLQPFEDEVYLHQTVAKSGDKLTRYSDLDQAFSAYEKGQLSEEWRVHFHVPIFLDDLGEFATTQNFIREILEIHKAKPISDHLEVETYTWNVLPDKYRDVDVTSAIIRELDWVRRQLAE